jgi:hypothetical protein
MQTLISTWIDGYESDPAQTVTATFERPVTGPSPLVTLNGPDGQVELVGELTIRAFIAQLERALGQAVRVAA